MPIERKAYSCKFKCARNVILSRKAMAQHEDRCFSNPSTRSCKTCANFESYFDSCGVPNSGFRVTQCEANAMKYDGDDSAILRTNCDDWKKQE